MVKVIRIYFDDLFPLLDLSHHAIVLFDATFSSYELDLTCVEDLEIPSASFGDIYHVMCDSGSECEEYLVNTCKVSALPCFIYYVDGQRVHTDYDMQFDLTRSQLLFRSSLPAPDVASKNRLPRRALGPSKNDFGMLFIGGDKSAVGKSTTCLCLLASLLSGVAGAGQTGIARFEPKDLAYIKPVTQCEADTTVTKFCNEVGIECVAIGPVVFFKGFTRSFLAGDSEHTRDEYLEQVRASVAALGLGKRLVLIDGVGYPSVGSICGLSNAEVCHALGQGPLRSPPVLLVGKPGVGDAIDSYNLNERYFQSFGVTVLGALFNKLNADRDNYYYVDNCRESIELYFRHKNQDRLARNAARVQAGGAVGTADNPFDCSESRVYGLVPMYPAVAAMTDVAADGAEMRALVAHFCQHANVRQILRDMWLYRHADAAGSCELARQRYHVRRGMLPWEVEEPVRRSLPVTTPVTAVIPPPASGAMDVCLNQASSSSSQQSRKRKSRAEINSAVEMKFGRTGGG